jgi:HD-GYP domain-containing protein (c-di-GMP phosphodiesterase class II)
MGFAGDEIPEFARIIGVADAFDSITSTRSYRKARTVAEGIAELRKGANSQFDPAIVEAFIAALDREGWKAAEPTDTPPDGLVVTVQDHDDPTAPLRVIETS